MDLAQQEEPISIHPPRAGRDDVCPRNRVYEKISIHPPRAGRDLYFSSSLLTLGHFNPPSPCGEGRIGLWKSGGADSFQSTLPVRGGTPTVEKKGAETEFQSTLPVRGGTVLQCQRTKFEDISIHPPRAGRDGRAVVRYLRTVQYFNPPSPCGEGLSRGLQDVNRLLFQSTLPVRGGTQQRIQRHTEFCISIHPPRAGRDVCLSPDDFVDRISIHPPRAGRDSSQDSTWPFSLYFNPPSPCGEGHDGVVVQRFNGDISIHPPRAGRDQVGSYMRGPGKISIHPPRAGRDTPVPIKYPKHTNFNPPSPCGEGRFSVLAFCRFCIFQSTLPVRGGTASI